MRDLRAGPTIVALSPRPSTSATSSPRGVTATKQRSFRIPVPRPATARPTVPQPDETLQCRFLQDLQNLPRSPRLPKLSGNDTSGNTVTVHADWLPTSPRGRIQSDTLGAQTAVGRQIQRSAISQSTSSQCESPVLRRSHHSNGTAASSSTSSASAASVSTSMEVEPSANSKPPFKVMDDKRWILSHRAGMRQSRSHSRDPSWKLSAEEHSDVMNVLLRLRLFGHLTEGQLADLIPRGRLRVYPRYSRLVREGTRGNSCFVILSGQVASFSTRATAQCHEFGSAGLNATPGGTTHGRGWMFGEAGLVTDVVRESTIHALTACHVLTFERSALLSHDRTDPNARERGRQHVVASLEGTTEWAELKKSVITDMLARLPFFGSLAPSRRSSLASLMEFGNFQPGDLIFSEGDIVNTCFYVVCDGTIDMIKASGRDLEAHARADRKLSTISADDDRPWFGEVAMWVNRPRHATATAVTETRLLVVESINFESFLELAPDFRGYINKSNSQATQHAKSRNVTLEDGALAERRGSMQSSVAIRWQSGASLGGGKVIEFGHHTDRSAFAERWERLVTKLILRSDEKLTSYSKMVLQALFELTAQETREKLRH